MAYTIRIGEAVARRISSTVMLKERKTKTQALLHDWALGGRSLRATPTVIFIAGVVGVVAGYGAVLFTLLIESVTALTVEPFVVRRDNWIFAVALCMVPAIGLLLVAWFTRRFAPEAQGHGVPEVITAVARNNGVIRPRVSVVKILASGFCIGTGGSVGREGPIVQIGSSLGSLGGKLCKLSPQHVKVLVAAGAAAGISATFNAPIAGVIFASEIILGNFAIGSLTPIVIAAVLADVVQAQCRAQGFQPAFPHLHYAYQGAWSQMPSYLLLGLMCGLAAVSFTKLVYLIEDTSQRWLPKWWVRALVLGLVVGVAGVAYHAVPPAEALGAQENEPLAKDPLPPLFGVGYGVVEHALHLGTHPPTDGGNRVFGTADKSIMLDRQMLIAELWWLLPLALLKPLVTSITLGGGGSGGIFAPSLFLGATLGASFGLVCNLFLPGWSANPGVYAIVGMGAVVAGTTHGVLSAILIVYELTNDYRIILPIMVAAGLSSIIAEIIDPESIYTKKLSRRGESVTRGHELHRLENVMVRDVMVRDFPTVHSLNDLTEIVRVARANPHISSLPVMNDNGKLVGIIHAEDLHRAIDVELPSHMVNADDIATKSPISVSPDENLLEALRDFGVRDVESLPVENGQGESRRLVGLLLRSDVMRRYRKEVLQKHEHT